MRSATWLFALCLSGGGAWAEEGVPPLSSAYQAIMKAQYAAQQPPLPARPEEAQKIYDVYLQSIGQISKARPDDADNSTTPSH